MKFLRYFLICFISNVYGQSFELKTGDLIFQESCSSSGMSGAIKAVTSGAKDYDFTHVGIVWIDDSHNIKVIEATTPKVSITPLQEFLFPKDKKCPPKSVAARLKPEYQNLIPKAIKYAKRQVGKSYDYAFNLKNNRFYCSELVYFAFYKANKNKAVFPLNVMTFKGSDGNFIPFWVEHFKKLDKKIPEGELGINPNAMFVSEALDKTEISEL